MGFIRKFLIFALIIATVLYFWNPLLLLALIKIVRWLGSVLVRLIIAIGNQL